MVADVITGLSSFKAMFDIAKSMKNLDDAVKRNEAVADLWEQIISAQTRYTAAIEQVNELKEKLASFETWDTEKEKYELKEIYPHNFAYLIKADARGTQPSHMICATCYESRKKIILQKASAVHLGCPECKTRVQFKGSDEPDMARRNRWSP